jgi:hypothetical protein
MVTIGDENIGEIELPMIGCLTINEANAWSNIFASDNPPRNRTEQTCAEVFMFLRSRVPAVADWSTEQFEETLLWPLIEAIGKAFDAERKSDPTFVKKLLGGDQSLPGESVSEGVILTLAG